MRVLLLLVLAAPAAFGQTEWRPASTESSVSLDALYAIGDDLIVVVEDNEGQMTTLDRLGVTSTAFLLSGRVRVGGRWAVLAEVPLGYTAYAGTLPSSEAFADSDIAFGNPYLGLEGRFETGVTLGAGVRVPVNRFDDAQTFGWQGGVNADRERFQAYLPDVLTVSASAAITVPAGPVRLHGRLAPALAIDVSGAENANGPGTTGLVLGYGVRAEGDVGAVTLHGGIAGQPWLGGDRFEVLDAKGTAVLGASARVRGVRPGVLLRAPLDDSYIPTDATVGLTLDVPIR